MVLLFFKLTNHIMYGKVQCILTTKYPKIVPLPLVIKKMINSTSTEKIEQSYLVLFHELFNVHFFCKLNAVTDTRRKIK